MSSTREIRLIDQIENIQATLADTPAEARRRRELEAKLERTERELEEQIEALDWEHDLYIWEP